MIFISLSLLISLFWYTQKLNDYESDIRNDKNFVNIECEIIDYNGKFKGSIFNYFHNNKELKSSQSFTSDFLKIGEKYEGRLNKFEPEVAILLLDKPIIDTAYFNNSLAKVIDINPQKFNLKSITYVYEILNKKYERVQYINVDYAININDIIDIYYKVDKNSIAYIKTGGNTIYSKLGD